MDDLIYEWKAEEPVQIVDNLNLPRFKLEHHDTDSCNTKTNTGKLILFQKNIYYSLYFRSIIDKCLVNILYSNSLFNIW
jgi:hypothetical protein